MAKQTRPEQVLEVLRVTKAWQTNADIQRITGARNFDQELGQLARNGKVVRHRMIAQGGTYIYGLPGWGIPAEAVNSRVCVTCGEELPLTSNYFHRRKDGDRAYGHECLVCRADRRAEEKAVRDALMAEKRAQKEARSAETAEARAIRAEAAAAKARAEALSREPDAAVLRVPTERGTTRVRFGIQWKPSRARPVSVAPMAGYQSPIARI